MTLTTLEDGRERQRNGAIRVRGTDCAGRGCRTLARGIVTGSDSPIPPGRAIC
jgi:hypothetical protein